MNKKLHKSLYSKKDKRPKYPTVNKVIQSNIDITDSINLDDVLLKKNRSVKNKEDKSNKGSEAANAVVVILKNEPKKI